MQAVLQLSSNDIWKYGEGGTRCACQMAWALLCVLNTTWLLAQSNPVVLAVSSWVHAAMPVVATILPMAILLWVGLPPTQLLFHAA